MRRLLVAARGLTAVRVARSARRTGWSPVGVVTTADRDAVWTQILDDAVEVAAYDDVDALLEAASTLGATGVHPGVGFAAEDPVLAQGVLQAGLVWAGPSPEALAVLADKAALSRLLDGLGVPAPLTDTEVAGPEDLGAFLTRAGGPVVLKAARGGGGRGIVRVRGEASPDEVAEAWSRATGLGPVVAQAEVGAARHLEVQALADGERVLTLGTRECSVQRRSQKVIEEAPAMLAPELVEAMEELTRRILLAADYRGAATCELLLARGASPVVLEVNARLQVEHAVTEEVCGVDLVAAQLLLAEGVGVEAALRRAAPRARLEGDRVLVAGHAAEARVYAEDPQTLLPQAGDLLALEIPLSLDSERAGVASGEPHPTPRLRVQRGTFAGDALRPEFSEPLALVTAVGASREEALDALDEALAQVAVRGPLTLVPLLRRALAEPALRRPAELTTTWLEEDLLPRLVGGQSGESAQSSAASPVSPGSTPSPPVPGGAASLPEELRAPMAATVIEVRASGPVRRGERVALLEAMKMRLPVLAGTDGELVTVLAPDTVPGPVRAGELLARVVPEGDASGAAAPALLEPTERRGRPRSALERVTALAEPGSLRGLVDADAVLTARARVAGREVALWAQDPTSLGGTIGLEGSRRVAALIDDAAAATVPVLSLLDGGGARVQEGVDALAGTGLILAAETRARGRTLQVGVVLGPAAGGAAYAPALTDVLVMVEGAGRVLLTGPAVLASVTGERVGVEELGGAALHAERAGTAHLTLPDERAALAAAARLVGYAPIAPLVLGGGRGLPMRAGGAGEEPVPTDAWAASALPSDASEPYDVREILSRLVDRGEILELRPAWAASAVTGLARVGGVPVGLVATQPAVLAGTLTAKSAQKVEEHVGLCERLGLPVLTLVDTPGFMPGVESEAAGVVRHGARLVAAYARAGERVRLLTLVTRRAYGGAFVALGSTSLTGALSLAWPTARIGVMDAGSAVDLTRRREIDALRSAQGEASATALRARLVAEQRAGEGPERAVELGWLDEVLAPGSTRSRLTRALTEPGPGAPPAPARRRRPAPGRRLGRLRVRAPALGAQGCGGAARVARPRPRDRGPAPAAGRVDALGRDLGRARGRARRGRRRGDRGAARARGGDGPALPDGAPGGRARPASSGLVVHDLGRAEPPGPRLGRAPAGRRRVLGAAVGASDRDGGRELGTAAP